MEHTLSPDGLTVTVKGRAGRGTAPAATSDIAIRLHAWLRRILCLLADMVTHPARVIALKSGHVLLLRAGGVPTTDMTAEVIMEMWRNTAASS